MSERTELFRPQAVAARYGGPGSAPVLQQNGLVKTLLFMVIVLLGMAVSLLGLTRYRETEPARGLLESRRGSYRVVAPAAAVVDQVHVTAGQKVARGQVLASLQRTRFDDEGRDMQELELAQLREQQGLLEEEQGVIAAHYAERSARLAGIISAQQASLKLGDEEGALYQEQLALATARLATMEKLESRGAISESQLDQSRLDHLGFRLRLQEARQRRQGQAVQLRLQQAQQSALAAEFDRGTLRVQEEHARLQYAITQLLHDSRLSVVAQADGIVSALAIAEHEYVAAGQPLLYLNGGPAALDATLYVPSRLLGKLAPGQELLLRYDAFDYQHYGRYRATIAAIAGASLDPREHLIPLPRVQEPVFAVTARIEQGFVEGPQRYPLQPGMMFSADIVLAEMSLLEFIFKPLLDLRARLS